MTDAKPTDKPAAKQPFDTAANTGDTSTNTSQWPMLIGTVAAAIVTGTIAVLTGRKKGPRPQ